MTVFDFDDPSMLEAAYPAFSYMSDWIGLEHAVHGRPTGHSPLDVQWWLKSALEAFDLRPSALARRAGLAPSTLNKFLDIDARAAGANNLSARTINKLSVVLQEEARKASDKEWNEFSGEVADQFSYRDKSFAEAAIVGELGVTFKPVPSDGSEFDDHSNPFPMVSLPITRGYERHHLLAFQIIDDVHAPIFIAGDIIVGAPIFLNKQLPPVGSYVVTHEDAGSGQLIADVRQFITDPSGREWLIPVGDEHTAHTHAIFGGAQAANRLKATATVLAVIRDVSAQKSA